MNAHRCDESKTLHTIKLSCGYRSELQEAHLTDDNIRRVLQWKEWRQRRPEWPQVTLEGSRVLPYWTQWNRVSLRNDVLYRGRGSGSSECWQ